MNGTMDEAHNTHALSHLLSDLAGRAGSASRSPARISIISSRDPSPWTLAANSRCTDWLDPVPVAASRVVVSIRRFWFRGSPLCVSALRCVFWIGVCVGFLVTKHTHAQNETKQKGQKKEERFEISLTIFFLEDLCEGQWVFSCCLLEKMWNVGKLDTLSF